LDEVARTLDYPGLTQLEPDEKNDAVDQLLRRQRVLVVVDNSETVGDGALVAWLLRLPEPSKAIVTSRQYRREFRRSCWPVELRGMTDTEARELIDQRLRVLKIAQLPSGPSQLDPLMAATGGNPKAIEVALGLIKYEHRPFQQVVDDLYAARGELFDDLFMRAWGCSTKRPAGSYCPPHSSRPAPVAKPSQRLPTSKVLRSTARWSC
jgi:hypothetical protein